MKHRKAFLIFIGQHQWLSSQPGTYNDTLCELISSQDEVFQPRSDQLNGDFASGKPIVRLSPTALEWLNRIVSTLDVRQVPTQGVYDPIESWIIRSILADRIEAEAI